MTRLANGQLEYSFIRLSSRTTLNYEVEVSDDLQSWTPIARSIASGVTQAVGTAASGITDLGGTTPTVRVRIPPPAATDPKKYLRLAVMEVP